MLCRLKLRWQVVARQQVMHFADENPENFDELTKNSSKSTEFIILLPASEIAMALKVGPGHSKVPAAGRDLDSGNEHVFVKTPRSRPQ